ncbi:MAG: arginine repressor [Eubacterium sp.]|nr:arginine repressor [Eubacterium sp.]
MKGKRQEKILELIKQYDIETQEELSKHLKAAGFSSTQGTISRDIRELKLTKVTGENGRQKYAPMHRDDIHVSSKYRRVLSEGIISMEDAENILVIKTVPGMAMACAAAIDSISIRGIVGCIAGDDTIFCVVKEKPMVEDVIEQIDIIRKGTA